jgi:hypothetical protein
MFVVAALILYFTWKLVSVREGMIQNSSMSSQNCDRYSHGKFLNTQETISKYPVKPGNSAPNYGSCDCPNGTNHIYSYADNSTNNFCK